MVVNAYPTKTNPVRGIFIKELVEELQHKGANTIVYDISRFKYFSVLNFKTMLKTHNIDVIHAQFGIPSGFCAALFKGKYPLITTIHRHEVVDDISKRLFKPFLNYALNKSDKIIAVSEYIFSEIVKLSPRSKNKILILNNAVNTTKFGFNRKYSKTNEICFGTIGNHIKRKGIDLFIKAYVEIERRFNNVKCLIAGNGPETEKLKKIAQDLKARNIKFLGRIPEEKKVAFYKSLDVFVLPSYSEGHPVSLLEAMSTGCCPVVSNIPSIRNTIYHNRNGKIFQIGDKNDLKEKLIELVLNKEEISIFGLNARKIVEERFSLKKRVEQLIALYKNVI